MDVKWISDSKAYFPPFCLPLSLLGQRMYGQGWSYATRSENAHKIILNPSDQKAMELDTRRSVIVHTLSAWTMKTQQRQTLPPKVGHWYPENRLFTRPLLDSSTNKIHEPWAHHQRNSHQTATNWPRRDASSKAGERREASPSSALGQSTRQLFLFASRFLVRVYYPQPHRSNTNHPPSVPLPPHLSAHSESADPKPCWRASPPRPEPLRRSAQRRWSIDSRCERRRVCASDSAKNFSLPRSRPWHGATDHPSPCLPCSKRQSSPSTTTQNERKHSKKQTGKRKSHVITIARCRALSCGMLNHTTFKYISKVNSYGTKLTPSSWNPQWF